MAGRMVGFGRKQAWLAIGDTDPDAVIAALGLRDLGPVGWRTGIDLVYLADDRLAVTPALPDGRGRDWVLVPGLHCFRARPDVAELSRRLGTEVQFFATYRVTETHRWERATGGELRRAFEYRGGVGEVALWLGEPDAHERAIGLPPERPGDDDSVLLAEADVMRLAGRWSIDPDGLDGREAPGPLRSVATNEG